MKISFNKNVAIDQSATLTEGRHIGTVIQIAGLGVQPAFDAGKLPSPCVGVVLQVAGTQITKMMRLSGHPMSALFAYFCAALPDPDGFDGDEPLPLTLGRPVAIEVSLKGRYTKIDSFHRPEDFELASAPTVAAADLVMLDDPKALEDDSGKVLFLKLHRDIRGWISNRVRGV